MKYRLLATMFLAACQPGASEAPPGATNAATSSPPEPAHVEVVPVPGAPASFADLVEEARPGVVNIFTRTRVRTNRVFITPEHKLIPEERVSESLGSGFVIDDEGHVLTNYHVIKDATDIVVRLFDERSFAADVLGDDPKLDIALLKLRDAESLPVLPMGDSQALRVGEWVVAIGNPFGLTSSVTAGIVSATGRRSLPMGGELAYQDFIQTDASINPGNSGGPLVNMSGEVVGINTAINENAQGIGFSIPMHMIDEVIDRLKSGGRVKRSWLGIYADPVPDALRKELSLPEKGGAFVKRVVDNGPAAKAKLQRGDVIVAIDGKSFDGPQELGWLASNMEVGSVAQLKVQRGSDSIDVPLKLGALPD